MISCTEKKLSKTIIRKLITMSLTGCANGTAINTKLYLVTVWYYIKAEELSQAKITHTEIV